MQTLTVQLPDSIDPALARWELARSLYEKGAITLDEAATMVDLAPTYFKIKIRQPFRPSLYQLRTELLASAKPFDRQKFDSLVEQLSIEESWEDLVSQIGK